MRAQGRHHALRMLAVFALLAGAAFPIYWMLVTSLTPSADLFAARPRLLPTLDQISVYKEVFATIPVATWLANSAIVAAGTMILSIALSVQGEGPAWICPVRHADAAGSHAGRSPLCDLCKARAS